MAFWYSVRLSRRKVSVRPGLGFAAAARSSEVSDCGEDGLVGVLVGAGQPGRRHGPGPQLADDLLPFARVVARVLRGETFERQARGPHLAVVAPGAVTIDGGGERWGRTRGARQQLISPRYRTVFAQR